MSAVLALRKLSDHVFKAIQEETDSKNKKQKAT
jgi:hypothetical protein